MNSVKIETIEKVQNFYNFVYTTLREHNLVSCEVNDGYVVIPAVNEPQGKLVIGYDGELLEDGYEVPVKNWGYDWDVVAALRNWAELNRRGDIATAVIKAANELHATVLAALPSLGLVRIPDVDGNGVAVVEKELLEGTRWAFQRFQYFEGELRNLDTGDYIPSDPRWAYGNDVVEAFMAWAMGGKDVAITRDERGQIVTTTGQWHGMPLSRSDIAAGGFEPLDGHAVSFERVYCSAALAAELLEPTHFRAQTRKEWEAELRTIERLNGRLIILEYKSFPSNAAGD